MTKSLNNLELHGNYLTNKNIKKLKLIFDLNRGIEYKPNEIKVFKFNMYMDTRYL